MEHIPPKFGQRFGRLVAMKPAARVGKDIHWWFKCDCGNKHSARVLHVRCGKTRSCGCLRRNTPKNATHGMTNTPEFEAWHAMKQRCNNPNHRGYRNYGGRGIKVCKRWLKFENFYADMGARPPGRNGEGPLYTLDRINNDGDYEPSNCRWATYKQQQNNKRKRAY